MTLRPAVACIAMTMFYFVLPPTGGQAEDTYAREFTPVSPAGFASLPHVFQRHKRIKVQLYYTSKPTEHL